MIGNESGQADSEVDQLVILEFTGNAPRNDGFGEIDIFYHVSAPCSQRFSDTKMWVTSGDGVITSSG